MCRVRGHARACARTAFACVKYGCVLHCVTQYLVDVVVCTGPSMEPTILSHDVILTDRWTPVRGRLHVGDIVVARSPSEPRQNVCKRVTGLAGDLAVSGTGITCRVPRGHVWLEGDNRANSNDSRCYGAVPAALVLGRVVCKLWPPLQGGWLSGDRQVAAGAPDEN